MHQNDPHDEFVKSRQNSAQYPRNLTRTLLFSHTLDSYFEKINAQESRLFHNTKKGLSFWELRRGYDEFEAFPPLVGPPAPFNTATLQSHLDINTGDPLCRFVFLEAQSQRSPLNCSREEFTMVLTHQQVMPTFLDILFTFGRQEVPIDFYYTTFRHEDYMSPTLNKSQVVPRLGRSGRVLQHCYNLHSVEESPGQVQWPWSIRQTAVYHSFDLENGQSTWIIVKGNDTIKKRIRNATNASKPHKGLGPAQFTSIQSALGATLLIHSIMMEWCDEHWRWYMNYVENEVRKYTKRTSAAPIVQLVRPDAPIPIVAPQRQGKQGTGLSRTGTAASHPVSESAPRGPGFLRSLSSLSQRMGTRTRSWTNSMPLLPRHTENPPVVAPALIPTPDPLALDFNEMFTFDEIQKMHELGDLMQEALLVIRLNRGVVRDIKSYYMMTTTSPEFPTGIRADLEVPLAAFLQRTESIEGDLKVQESRLQTLIRLVEDSRSLFYGIVQYRSIQAAKYYSENAAAAADDMASLNEKMHDTAQKTEQQTVSMHVITVFTLIFLPGTFLATFFSSGVLQWSGQSPDGSSGNTANGASPSDYSWVLMPDRLMLFVKVCLPMMAITLLAWVVIYIYQRAKRRDEARNLNNEEKAQGSS